MDEEIQFLPSGDTGLTVQFGDRIDRQLSRRVVRFRSALEAAALPGVVETVPTYRSLLIHYDPLETTQARLIEEIGPVLRSDTGRDQAEARAWHLPVCFDAPGCAPDLDHVAAWAGLGTEEVVDALTAIPFHVYMLGFAPGQPYMGDLPESLAIPRREDPIPRIAAGSVVIATGMAVIYPIPNPTGWHVVGRTPATLFDPSLAAPALLRAGDRVTLHRVGAQEYEGIAARLASGDRSELLGPPP